MPGNFLKYRAMMIDAIDTNRTAKYEIHEIEANRVAKDDNDAIEMNRDNDTIEMNRDNDVIEMNRDNDTIEMNRDNDVIEMNRATKNDNDAIEMNSFSRNEEDDDSHTMKHLIQTMAEIKKSGRSLVKVKVTKLASVWMKNETKNLRPSSRGKSSTRLTNAIRHNMADKKDIEISLLPHIFSKSPSSLAEAFITNPVDEKLADENAFETNDGRSKRIWNETIQITKLGTP